MKVKALASLLLFTAFGAIAQPKLGVIVGPSFTTQKWVSNAVTMGGVKSALNFHVGVTTDFPLNYNLSLQPELYYSFQKQSITQQNVNLYNYNNYTLGYLKMPVLMTYMREVGNIWWYLGAGPYLSGIVNTNTTFLQNDQRISAGAMRVGYNELDQVIPVDYGYKIKAGFELSKGVNINFFYDRGLKDINPQFLQTYNRTFGVSFLYLFSLNENDKYNRYPDYYNY